MGIKSSVGCLFAAGILGVTSYLNFSKGESTRVSPEYELLTGASKYMEHFSGGNPNSALDYAKTTLSIIKNNDSFREGASKLEKELSEVDFKIRNSEVSEVYQPVLKNFGKKMYQTFDYSSNTLWGIGTMFLGLGALFFSIYSLAPVDNQGNCSNNCCKRRRG
jgi:hypothetical protein